MFSMELNINSSRRRKIYSLNDPQEIGCYSLDGERNFHDDSHQMKYLNEENVYGLNHGSLYLNLNLGSQKIIKKDFIKREKISPILNWIVRHPFVENSSNSNGTNIDFVCARGLLRKIALTYCELWKDWTFCASKHKSVIYLCDFDTSAKKEWRNNITDQNIALETWNAKFVQNMTSDLLSSESNASVPVNEKEEYHAVFKGKLNHHTLLYNAQVDGRNQSKDSYVEFKLVGLKPGGDYKINCYRLASWYLQSFLAGIPEIIIGLRDERGIVETFEKLNTSEIIPHLKGEMGLGIGINLCSDILDFVKKCVKEDNPNIVYKFSRDIKTPTIKCEKLDFPGEYQVLPEWYTKL